MNEISGVLGEFGVFGALALIAVSVAQTVALLRKRDKNSTDFADIMLTGFTRRIEALEAERDACVQKIGELQEHYEMLVARLTRMIGQLQIEKEWLRQKTGDRRSEILNGATDKIVGLHDAMNDYLAQEEIELVCFNMGIDSEQLDRASKARFVRALLVYCDNRKLINNLIDELARLRSDVEWEKYRI